MSADAGSHERHQAPAALIAGRFELKRLIARGGMGEVYAAYDRSKERPVALKRLLARASSPRSSAAQFMREYHALSALRHPRIIEVYEYGVDGETPFYTMELLDGKDLRDLSPLPYREACRYLRDVASSLALLHARRLLHRDVSPRNVRCTNDGHCKLLDFGAMIPFGVPPNVTGTAPCIAPEALHGSGLDQRSDLYALGALAYCVLTGRHGYAVSQIEELPDAWRKPLIAPKRSVDIPNALDELVISLMSLDPMKRPRSAAEVIDWLSAVGELEPDETYGVAQSFFTSTPLCGREMQLETIARHVKRAPEGHGQALVVMGGVGSGKSRMLAEAGLYAQTCGLSVAHAVARPTRTAGAAVAQEWIAALQQVAPVEAEAAGASGIEWLRLSGGGATDLEGREAANPAEQRSRFQQSLLQVITAVAKSRPLLLAVDDLDRADEESTALVAALAHEATKLPLVLIASCGERPSRTGTELEAVRNVGAALLLRDLDATQSEQLVRSIFGGPPNVQLLIDWLYKAARGNPKLTLELAEHLFLCEQVRYVDGQWVVPPDGITLEVPADLRGVWALRLQGLSPPAADLVDLLALRRGGVSTDLCLAAAKRSEPETFSAIAELVRAGILESAGSEYVFAQELLRSVVEQRMQPERRRELHQRWADTLLAEPSPSPEQRLEAGWHLVHTDNESRGLDLLSEVAPAFVERGVSMAAAIPAIEKALELSEKLGRPLALQLRLRSTLVLAGYLFDYRLVFRYGEQTLAMLQDASGMGLAKRIGKVLGPHIGLILGFATAAVRRWLSPRLRRGPPVFVAVQYFVRAAMGMMGVRATSLDGPGVAAIFDKLSPLEGTIPRTSGRAIYLSCRALATQMLGRESELKVQIDEALAELRRGRRSDMNELEYHSLLVGMLLADGVNESYREASQALARADLLDGIGTHLARAGALRIRMIYYARRGDAERAEECRRLIELQAIQGGTVWQGEWFSVPLEGLAGATWSDLVSVRRALDRLERLAKEVPALATMRDAARVSYHFRRGEYARVEKLGTRYIAAHPPRMLVGWPPTYGIIALAMIELGQVARARSLCEDALSHVADEDLSYFVMYAPLEMAYATALAVTGEYERAKQLVSTRIERLRAHGEYASLVNLFQYQARMAQLVGDKALLAESLQAMREAALTSNLPAVILLADRVVELRAKRRSSPLPPPSTSSEQPTQQSKPAAEQTAVTRFLQRSRPGRTRGREALWLASRYMASDEAYLYRIDAHGIVLVSSVPDGHERPEVTSLLRVALDATTQGARHEGIVTLGQLPGEDPGDCRWLMFLVRSPRREGVVGAVVLRASADTPAPDMSSMLAELAAILADDLRSGSASTQPPPGQA